MALTRVPIKYADMCFHWILKVSTKSSDLDFSKNSLISAYIKSSDRGFQATASVTQCLLEEPPGASQGPQLTPK